MSTRFPMLPWEREHARIGHNLIPVRDTPVVPYSVETSGHLLDRDERMRKDFVKFARMTGTSEKWRRAWMQENPEAWEEWREARLREGWPPDQWPLCD